jgi:TldD protein
MTGVNPFPIGVPDLQPILRLALESGGEFAEIYMERRASDSILMEDDIIKETAESVSLGLGIRVITGDQTGFGYTNDLSEDSIRRAAKTASAISSGRMKKRGRVLKEKKTGKTLYAAVRPSARTGFKTKIKLVNQAYDAALAYHSSIAKVKARILDSLQHSFILNSEGLFVQDSRPLVKLVCTAVAERNGKKEGGFSGDGGRVGINDLGEDLKALRIGEEAAREAVLLLEAGEAPAGEMPIVLSPGHSGVLIHEAVGHLLEADFNRKKTSIFWNKMGKKVGSDQLTIYDDPTIPRFRGSYHFDDEGTIPRKTRLIDKGTVCGFLQDRLSARLMGLRVTGHGRRQDFAHTPLPRMANTYIAGGEYAPEEIVRSVAKGFYVAHLQGGQVEDSGKFTFSVSLGYLIENGTLTRPVKQATLIGTNIDILKRIERVGSDLTFGLQTGTCSKEGQDVPVTDGCPTMKISRMTVGGIE